MSNHRHHPNDDHQDEDDEQKRVHTKLAGKEPVRRGWVLTESAYRRPRWTAMSF
jgi:hypothetical protein